MRRSRRKNESGFALLLVFMMAASVAIMLYTQLPRAAFEAQRGKEELLQDRGDQYIRAIQLYVAKWRSYPPNLDALEKTNNVRYLRRRYKDPMTGKDEWRAVHVNAAGQLVDSIVQKQGAEKKEAVPEFVSELPSVGSTASSGVGEAGAQNVALRRRPSDNAPGPGNAGGGAAVDPLSLGNGATVAPPQPFNPQQPTAVDPNTGQPVQHPAQPQAAGQPGVAPAPGQQPYPQGGPQGFNPQQQPTMPSANPTPGQPSQPGQQQNAGLDMINRILTTPRSNMNMGVPGATGLQVGGGIAGFASTFEAPSIKIYNDRQKYNEWEFIYDMKKDKRLLGAAAGAMQNMQNMQNQNPLGRPPGSNSSAPTPTPPPNPNLFGGQQPGRR